MGIDRHVGLDSRRYIRLLERVGFLRTVQAEEGGKVARADRWPPPAEFFKGSPIGIAYYGFASISRSETRLRGWLSRLGVPG
jgi:hypothetical protein